MAGSHRRGASRGEQPEPAAYAQAVNRLEDCVRQMVPAGESVVHFEVVIETKSMGDPRGGRRRRFATPGSSPAYSVGVLVMAALEAALLGLGWRPPE